jgi:Tfp pilus assembly protein PilF
LNEALAKDNEKIAYNIGLIYLKSKKREQAASYFESALEINSEYEPAVRILAKMDQM